jgi:hypothetical protein
MASFSVGWLLYANLLKPSRTYRRLLNNQSGRFSLFYFLRKSCKTEIGTNVVFDKNRPSESLQLAELALRTHGAVVIENYYPAKVIEKFTEFYKRDINELTAKESRFGNPLIMSKELLNLWLDPLLYEFMKNYFGTRPYCRSYPFLQYVDKNSTKEFKDSKNGVAYPWHVDHCTIFVQMVYLSDINQSGTCMEIVSGSHHYPNVGISLHSDEYVDSCGLPVIKLSGPKGSVQLHDPNVVHRARPVFGSDRLWLYSDFSWGENILFDLPTAIEMLRDSNEALATATPTQRDAVVGIFPNRPNKGYTLNNGFLTTQVSQDI